MAEQSREEIARDFARDIAANCGHDVDQIAVLIERAMDRALPTPAKTESERGDALDRVANRLGIRHESLRAALSSEGLAPLVEQDARSKQFAEAVRYAKRLAVSLAARWYPEIRYWRPLRGDLIGLLNQIDNMSTGAVRKQSDATPAPLEKLVSIVEDGAFGWGVLLNGTPVKCLFSTRVDAEEWLRATLTAPLGDGTREALVSRMSDAILESMAVDDGLNWISADKYARAALASLPQQAGSGEPTFRDMAYFGASEAAGYHYPEEDQQALRDAYCRGAAEYVPANADAPGLIKAAEWHEERAAGLADEREEANKRSKFHHYMASKEELLHATCAKHLRSLAHTPASDTKEG